jgi:hypothetical protein
LDHPAQNEKPITQPLEYGRKYMGVSRNGRKIILTDAVCPTFLSGRNGDRWKSGLVKVKGGGSCFFSFEFDPKTKQFSNLIYNADE